MKNSFNKHLIIFARYPMPGESKTRLIPALGPKKAAMLQKALTELTLDKIMTLQNTGMIQARVFFCGSSREDMQKWLGKAIILEKQPQGNLGQKMSHVFNDCFCKHGASHAVIIGTDIHDLSAGIIVEAFNALEKHDLVLGPAADGGYYLIGLNTPQPELFDDIEWGASSVLEATLRKAEVRKMRVHLLGVLNDIDRPQDLIFLSEDFLASSLIES